MMRPLVSKLLHTEANDHDKTTGQPLPPTIAQSQTDCFLTINGPYKV